MALELGSRVGPYKITAEIGAGGMGVVYRAHDSRLGGDVAIKVSAERTLADILAQRRSSPGLPLDETLRIARQISSALQAADEKGVVHRVSMQNFFDELRRRVPIGK